MQATRARGLSSGLSRRQFLGAAAGVPFLTAYHRLAAAERKRVKIRDVQTMTMQGASRTYVLVRIVSDDGLYGIGEAYGSPGVGVSEQILSDQAVARGERSAGDRCPVHRLGCPHERPFRHPHGWLCAQLPPRRQRHRDGLVGSCGQSPLRAHQHAAGRKIPEPGPRLRP